MNSMVIFSVDLLSGRAGNIYTTLERRSMRMSLKSETIFSYFESRSSKNILAIESTGKADMRSTVNHPFKYVLEIILRSVISS